MDTFLSCGLCGTELKEKYCSFCEMELDKSLISKNSKRLEIYKKIKHLPEESLVYSGTKELMKMETINLLCLLKVARRFRSDAYKIRKLRHDAEKQAGLTTEVKEIAETSYKEYDDATRRVWVIENIIKHRIGYYPLRVTDNFLGMFLDRIKESEKKQMIIKGG